MFFKSQPVRLLAVIGFALMTAATANADVIIEHQGTRYREEANTFAPLAEIVVGSSDVRINGFGVFGQTSARTNIKWVIFDSVAPNAPALLSAKQQIDGTPGSFATNARWYDSPEIDFTLRANHRYAMGVLADRLGPMGFRWGLSATSTSPAHGVSSLSAYGVSMPFSAALANAGLSGSFAETPMVYTFAGQSDSLQWNSSLQPSLHIMAPIPELREWAMILVGLVVVAFAVRRHKRNPSSA